MAHSLVAKSVVLVIFVCVVTVVVVVIRIVIFKYFMIIVTVACLLESLHSRLPRSPRATITLSYATRLFTLRATNASRTMRICHLDMRLVQLHVGEKSIAVGEFKMGGGRAANAPISGVLSTQKSVVSRQYSWRKCQRMFASIAGRSG